MMMRHTSMRLLLLLSLLLFPVALLLAQDKKKPAPKKKEEPKVIVALPFGVTAPTGKAARVTLRGLALADAREVRITPKGTARLISKGAAAVPDKMEPKQAGNTQAEVEVTLPADVPGDAVQLVVVTPAGQTPPHRLLIDRPAPLAEKEPNDGFKQAQPIALGQTVAGAVGRAQDVDVFRFEGKAGQKVVIEVTAARLGGVLDSFLTLHDAEGRILDTSDDDEDGGSADSRIEATLAKTGGYFVSLTDAHDQGGPLYAYRLSVREKK